MQKCAPQSVQVIVERKAKSMTRHTSEQRMKIGIVLDTGEGSLEGRTPTFRDLQTMAQVAEQVGLDSLWLSDHLIYRFPGQDESAPWEAFTMLSALAAVTTRIALGPLVACTSFRPPGSACQDGRCPRRDQRWPLHPGPRSRLASTRIRSLWLSLRSPGRTLRGSAASDRASAARRACRLPGTILPGPQLRPAPSGTLTCWP